MSQFIIPFEPYHSNRSRISTAAYERELSEPTLTLDEIFAIHRGERKCLQQNPEKRMILEGETKVWDVSFRDALRIRRKYEKAARSLKNVGMDPQTKFLYSTSVLTQLMLQSKMRVNSGMAVAALGVNPHLVRKKKQEMLETIVVKVEEALGIIMSHVHLPDSTPTSFDLNSEGRPLLGLNAIVEYKRFTVADIKEFLRGMVQFAYADHFETRKGVEKRFPFCVDGKTKFKLGGGIDIPYFRKKLGSLYLEDVLMRREDIGPLTEAGILIFDPRPAEYPDAVNRYVRLDSSGGLSDVAGLSYQRIMYGKMRMLGGVIMDGADTWKSQIYDPFYGSFPFYLGRFIEVNYKAITGEDLVSEQEIYEMVYLSAKRNVDPISVSKSHRYLASGDPSPILAIVEADFENRRSAQVVGERIEKYLALAA